MPPHVKGKINKMIVQPAMLYGMETVQSLDSREETGSDRNEDVQMGMRLHAERPCENRKHQGETEDREYIGVNVTAFWRKLILF